MEKIVVIGAGSWGTALAVLLAKKGNEVVMWEYMADKAKELQEKRENPLFLPGVKFPDNLTVTNSLENILEDSKYLLLSVPAQVLRKVVPQIASQLREDVTIINSAKGIEVATGLRLSEVIKEEILGKYHKNIIALSGPTHAEEVSIELPSAIVAAGDLERGKKVQQLFSTEYFRVYTSTDILGVELGGAVKNCIAITSGISDGLGYGDNSRAALITRGLAEMSRFGEYFGANPVTFAGLAGMGDLIVTCTSKHSRNRGVGERIGKGEKVEDILASMVMVAEGVPTLKAVKDLADKYEISMPIVEATYGIVYEGKSIKEALQSLMNRELKEEFRK